VAKGIESPLQVGETINDQEVKLAYGCAAPSRFVGIDQHGRWKNWMSAALYRSIQA
jgi:hypothetical protein